MSPKGNLLYNTGIMTHNLIYIHNVTYIHQLNPSPRLDYTLRDPLMVLVLQPTN